MKLAFNTGYRTEKIWYVSNQTNESELISFQRQWSCPLLVTGVTSLLFCHEASSKVEALFQLFHTLSLWVFYFVLPNSMSSWNFNPSSIFDVMCHHHLSSELIIHYKLMLWCHSFSRWAHKASQGCVKLFFVINTLKSEPWGDSSENVMQQSKEQQRKLCSLTHTEHPRYDSSTFSALNAEVSLTLEHQSCLDSSVFPVACFYMSHYALCLQQQEEEGH